MTSGSLWKNILLFSLPLMGSQVLEVLFNLSDVAVVGRFADYLALGAVGSTTLLVTLFTGILIGMGAGVNVRVAHELGAGNRKGTEETIHTSLLLCAIAGLLVCIICLLFSGQMLAMMNTKPELIDQAVLYMKIYALGMPAMAVYNFGNGVLSARGDTKRPLIYLSIAGVINVLLNLFFVIVCHMAAAGVATASAISLYVSAFLVMSHLLRRTDDCKVSLRKIRLHPKACKAVLLLGIPTGLQNGIFAIANLFVQAGVNSFDAVMVSGNHRSELGCRKPKTNAEILRHQYYICIYFRRDLGWAASDLWPAVPVAVCYRTGCYRCRYAEDPDHGLQLCLQLFYGWQHRCFPWHRKKYPSHRYRHPGILCIPYHLDLHGVRTFPDDIRAVSSLYLLMGDHRICGNSFLCYQLQKNTYITNAIHLHS